MLKGKKLKALELLVSGECKSYSEVAQRVEISQKTLFNWRSEEEFSQELKRRIDLRISSSVPRAVRRIEKIIGSQNEEVALKACKDILDRSGYKASDRVELDGKINQNAAVEVRFEGELNEWSK